MMHKVLSKPGYEKFSLSEQEFYELRIDDADDALFPGLVVKQTRIGCNENDKRFLCEEPDCERWPGLTQAQARDDIRLQALRAKGFTESDMETFCAIQGRRFYQTRCAGS
jgi:hypothetical protein